jgi:predicted metal-dependent hydrolase
MNGAELLGAGLAPAQDGRPPGTAPTWHDAEDLRWAARHWATRIGVQLRQVHVRPMRTKWASMSTAGRLTLNSEVLALPRSTGEYVIVHELVHLLAPNHGKVFKSFMAAYLPDWEEREKTLRSPNLRYGN